MVIAHACQPDDQACKKDSNQVSSIASSIDP
jgi:hypothetical protein